MRNADFVQACFLVKNGIPFERIFQLSGPLQRVEQAAMAIQFSIFNGAKFNFNSMSFED